jgi:Bacterial mobilisation protein (MobC)
MDPEPDRSALYPDEEPSPCDPREGRAALAHPAQPCADWIRASAGGAGMSKSQKRKRLLSIHARVTPEEKAALAEKAKAFGGISAMFRTVALDAKPARSKVDVQAMAQVLASLGKIGSNLNQIARHMNSGRPGDTVENLLEVELRDLMEMRQAVMRSLGLEPGRKPPKA